MMKHIGLGLGLLVGAAACSPVPTDRGSIIEPQIEADPAAISDIHNSLMVLDSHLDTPVRFHLPNYNFSKRSSWEKDGSQVDLPRMEEGGLDGGFWVIFTPQGPLTEAAYAKARDSAFMRQSAIREWAGRYKDHIGLAFTADDAARLYADGKMIAYQSMENAYPFGEDLSLLETFYLGGLRMLGPLHFSNNQFGDSSTDEPVAGGLTELGKELVREANRLGLVLDGSHASDEVVWDMLEVSKTPIILSHSGAKAIYDHPRNVPDDLILEIAAAGGVIQINAFGGYLEELSVSPERASLLSELFAKYDYSKGPLSPEAQEAYYAERKAIDQIHPPSLASFEAFTRHMLYILELVGSDHVGIGADWDGGGGVEGMNDVAALPRITEVLLNEGYTREDLEKIWGGNMIRLLREAEAAREVDLGYMPMVN